MTTEDLHTRAEKHIEQAANDLFDDLLVGERGLIGDCTELELDGPLQDRIEACMALRIRQAVDRISTAHQAEIARLHQELATLTRVHESSIKDPWHCTRCGESHPTSVECADREVGR